MLRLLDDFPSVRFSFHINHHDVPFGRASWEKLGCSNSFTLKATGFSELIMLILVLFGFFVCCLFFLMKKSEVPVRDVSFLLGGTRAPERCCRKLSWVSKLLPTVSGFCLCCHSNFQSCCPLNTA